MDWDASSSPPPTQTLPYPHLILSLLSFLLPPNACQFLFLLSALWCSYVIIKQYRNLFEQRFDRDGWKQIPLKKKHLWLWHSYHSYCCNLRIQWEDIAQIRVCICFSHIESQLLFNGTIRHITLVHTEAARVLHSFTMWFYRFYMVETNVRMSYHLMTHWPADCVQITVWQLLCDRQYCHCSSGTTVWGIQSNIQANKEHWIENVRADGRWMDRERERKKGWERERAIKSYARTGEGEGGREGR